MTPIRIGSRFHGPPDSGNGGYVCGVVAAGFGEAAVTVRLHRPPPLQEPMELIAEGEGVVLSHRGQPIATARVAPGFDLEGPNPPALQEAGDATRRYAGHSFHRFPTCFVCGPERPQHDGLEIYPGLVGEKRVAAVWVPAPDLADQEGRVRPEFLWAALDCPGYWAVHDAAGLALLGEMTAEIEDEAVASGEPLIVTGWGISSEGRKHLVGSALHRPGGSLVASAEATWITISG